MKVVLSSPGLRQSMILIGGSLFAGVFSAIALILISRHLGPVLFAEFTVGYSLLVIITRIQSLGLNVALQKIAGPYFHHDDWEKDLSKLLRVGSRINALIIAGSIVCGLIFALPISRLLHFPNPWIIFGSFLLASVTMVFEYGTAVLQMIHKFSESVMMLVAQAISKLGVSLAIQFLGVDSVGLLFYIFYVSPILSMSVFAKVLPKHIHILPLEHDIELEKKLWRIMRHSVILMATVGVIDYLDILFVQRFTSPFQTGIYGGMAEITTAVSLIAYSLASVLNARVARYHELTQLKSFITKSMVIVFGALIAFVFYLPFVHFSIQISLGHQYIAGEKYLPLLIFSGVLLIMSVPFSALFYSFDHPKYFSMSGIGQMLITIVGGLIFIPRFGLEGAAWVKIATRLFLLLFTMGFALYGYRQKKLKRSAVPIVLPSSI